LSDAPELEEISEITKVEELRVIVIFRENCRGRLGQYMELGFSNFLVNVVVWQLARFAVNA